MGCGSSVQQGDPGAHEAPEINVDRLEDKPINVLKTLKENAADSTTKKALLVEEEDSERAMPTDFFAYETTPEVTLFAEQFVYHPGMGETFLFDQAEITGPDTTNFSGGSLVVKIVSDFQEACHRLTLTRNVTGIRVDGSDVYVTTTVTDTTSSQSSDKGMASATRTSERKIGVITKGRLGSGLFKVTFTSTRVSRLDIRSLVRALTFRTTDEPTVRYGQPIELTLRLHNGLASTVTQVICVLPPGDSPVISVFSPEWTYTEFDNRKARAIAPSLALAKSLEVQSGGSIRVEFLSGNTIDDTLTLMPDCKFSVGTDRVVTFRNTPIGVLKAGTLGSSRFLIEFQAPPMEDNQPRVISLKVAMSLLSSIGYQHHGSEVMPGYRVIRLTVCAVPGQDYVATIALKVSPLQVPREVLCTPVVCYDGSSEAVQILAAETARTIMAEVPGDFGLTSLRVVSRYVPGTDKDDRGVVSFEAPITDSDVDPGVDLVRVDNDGLIYYRNEVTAKITGRLQTVEYTIDFGEKAPWTAVEAILRRVSYDAGAEMDGSRIRIVEFSWVDSADREVNWRQPIHVVDDKLHIYLPFSPVACSSPGSPVAIFPEVRLSRGDGVGNAAGFGGGGVRVWVSTDGLGDQLHISILQDDIITVTHSNVVRVYGEPVGYVTSADVTAGSPHLEITFNSGEDSIATGDVVECLLQHVSFTFQHRLRVRARYPVRLAIRDRDGVVKETWRVVEVLPDSPRGFFLQPPPWTYSHRFGHCNLFPSFDFGKELDAGLFANGWLFAQVENPLCVGDTLGFDTTGTDQNPSPFTMNGDRICYHGVPIGEVLATAPTTLKIEFDEDSRVVTRQAVRDVIRRLYFRNSSRSPGRGLRTVSVTLADGKDWTQTATASLAVSEALSGRPFVRLGSSRLLCAATAVGQLVASQASLAGIPLGMLSVGGHMSVTLEGTTGDTRKDSVAVLCTDGLDEVTHNGKPCIVFENILVGVLSTTQQSVTLTFDDAKPGSMHLRVFLHHIYFSNPRPGACGRRKLLFSLADGDAEPEVTSKLLDVIDTRRPQSISFIQTTLTTSLSDLSATTLLAGVSFGSHSTKVHAPLVGTTLSVRMLGGSARLGGQTVSDYINFLFPSTVTQTPTGQPVRLDEATNHIYLADVLVGKLLPQKPTEDHRSAPLRIRLTSQKVTTTDLRDLLSTLQLSSASIGADSFIIVVALKSGDGAISAAQLRVSIPDTKSRGTTQVHQVASGAPGGDDWSYYSESGDEPPGVDDEGSYYSSDEEGGKVDVPGQPVLNSNGHSSTGKSTIRTAPHQDSSYYSYSEPPPPQPVQPSRPRPSQLPSRPPAEEDYSYYSDP